MIQPPTDTASKHQAAIESFPRTLEKVRLMWKSREFDLFVRRMLLDSRDGARQGFPMAVAHEMVFLAETNRLVRAIEAAETLRIPFPEALKMVVSADEANLAADVWDDPSVSNERYSPRATSIRQRAIAARRVEGVNPFFSLVRFVFSKWFLIAVAVILSVKALAPSLKGIFYLLF